MGTAHEVHVPIMTRNDNVLSALKAIGLVPDDIDVVVCSHLPVTVAVIVGQYRKRIWEVTRQSFRFKPSYFLPRSPPDTELARPSPWPVDRR